MSKRSAGMKLYDIKIKHCVGTRMKTAAHEKKK